MVSLISRISSRKLFGGALRWCLGVAAAVAPALVAPNTAHAINPRWDPLNEPGTMGYGSCVRVSPFSSSTILVSGDIYASALSTDSGANWRSCIGAYNSACQNDFTWVNSSTVWLGTLAGPYLSTDGGVNWTLKRNGMPATSTTTLTAPIQKVCVDPNTPSTLLAFGGNHRHQAGVSSTGWGAVWRSTDSGTTWALYSTIPSAPIVNNASFAATSSSIVYAATDIGVYKSTDSGLHWVAINTGLPSTFAWSMAVHPTDPNTVWVGLGGGSKVYKTTTGGTSWGTSFAGINNASTADCRALAVSKSNPLYLYCGFWQGSAYAYRSTDGGANWTAIVSAGVTTLNGGTYHPDAIGFQWLDVDPSNNLNVIGTAGASIYRSTDAGATWDDEGNFAANGNYRGTGFSGLSSWAVRWNPSVAGQVFTLGHDAGKLQRSTDYLWSWKHADSGLVGIFNGSNEVSFAGSTIYVATGQSGSTGVYVNEKIAKSTNSGSTWGYVGTFPTGASGWNKSIYVNPTNANQLWAVVGTDTSTGLYASADGGTTWAPRTLASSGTMNNIAADPVNHTTFYVATNAGIFKTTDGTNFVLMSGSPGAANFSYVFVDPVTTTNIYAIVFNAPSSGGVYKFNGSSWTRIFLNVGTAKPFAKWLAVDPNNSARIAVVTRGFINEDVVQADGIWITENSGGIWTQCNQGLKLLSGNQIFFNPDKSGQLIAAMDGGFFVTDVGVSTPFGGTAPNIPGTVVQAENYDLGGESIAYHDTTAGNQGLDTYRSDGVDIKAEGTGHAVCNTVAGEWLKYQVNVTSTAAYNTTFHIISGTGTFHLEANGVNVTGPVTVSGAGDITVSGVRYTAGTQFLKLYIETGGFDIDYFTIGSNLNGSFSTPVPGYNLTSLGSTDWAHWGRSGTYGNFDHKTTGGSKISNVTPFGTGEAHGGFSSSDHNTVWSDGTPTPSSPVGGENGYIWSNGTPGSGFTFTVPSTTSTQTLDFFIGGSDATVQITAHLSDGSSPDYQDQFDGVTTKQCTVTFKANTAGTLTITVKKFANIHSMTSGSADLVAAWLH